MKEGEGKKYLSNGEICEEGTWSNDNYYGSNTINWENGDKYEG